MSSRSGSASPPTSWRSSTIDRGVSNLTQNFRHQVLEPNNVYVDDEMMDETAWADLAFALGISVRENMRFSAETAKLAQRLRRKRSLTSVQVADYLTPYMNSIFSTHTRLSVKQSSRYYDDAVPTAELLKNTVNRLPTPKPLFSVGYQKRCFPNAYEELQDGIIEGPGGNPCDLGHISEPTSGQLWPFFLIEIADDSVLQATQHCAISGSTCNNAIDILCDAASGRRKDWSSKMWSMEGKMARAFSLSVCGKTAHLNTHAIGGTVPHLTTTIAIYALDDEQDLARLADRLHSIAIWGQFCRLPEIITILDKLDAKVHGGVAGSSLRTSDYEFDPACLKNFKLQPPRRPGRVKAVLRTNLARWL